MTESVETPDIADDLRLVRQGTAFFAKILDELPDDDFVLPSLLPDWSRSHVIAHVGYNARALHNLMEWASTGVEHPMYGSAEARDLEIEQGSTLSPHELRTLYRQSAADLDAAWAAMTDTGWNSEVRGRSGLIPASKTLWMRSREVWLHAVDLDAGANFSDLPAGFLSHLLADVLNTWRGRRDSEDLPNFILHPTEGGTPHRVSRDDSEPGIVLRGTTAALASWATGRGNAGVEATQQPVPAAPAWL